MGRSNGGLGADYRRLRVALSNPDSVYADAAMNARILFPILLALAGCAAAPAPDSTPPARDGAAVYLRVCSVCHGEKGDGRSRAAPVLATPPRDFTRPEAARDLSREYMIAIVRDGRPHTPMVGRGERLSQQEIEAAVDYIRATFMKKP